MEDESLGVRALGIRGEYIHVAREPAAQPRSPSEGWPIVRLDGCSIEIIKCDDC
jgi:hypothetical protein